MARIRLFRGSGGYALTWRKKAANLLPPCFDLRMQIEFLFRGQTPRSLEQSLDVSGKRIPIRLARHPRARRYVLRLCPDGTARVTVPRGGSALHALDFARKQTGWLEKQLLRQALTPPPTRTWSIGTQILFRGEIVELRQQHGTASNGRTRICFADQVVSARAGETDLRPSIEKHMWRLAGRELPPETFKAAGVHGLKVQRVSVRNQRSRWGSCSRRGTISLNWRLVQTPVFVRDYIILHELAHMRFMNHSKRYWAEVKRMCPDFERAEKWLKQNSDLLR